MTNDYKEKKQIHTGCEFSLQLVQGTFHFSTSTDIWGFTVARKVSYVYVGYAQV